MIVIEIYSSKCLYSKQFAKQFFTLLESTISSPNKIGLCEPLKMDYTKERAIDMHLDLEGNEFAQAGGMIGKIKNPNVKFMTWWSKEKNLPNGNVITLFIAKKSFQKNEDKYLVFFKKIIALTEANYAYITTKEEEDRQYVPGTLKERLSGIFWCNYYGKTLTEFFGKVTLFNAGWNHVEELENGTLTFVGDEKSVYSLKSEEIENIKKRLKKDCFGVPKTFDIELSNEQQAKIVPKLKIKDWE